jgi:hypothetical protein
MNKTRANSLLIALLTAYCIANWTAIALTYSNVQFDWRILLLFAVPGPALWLLILPLAQFSTPRFSWILIIVSLALVLSSGCISALTFGDVAASV